MSEDYEKRNWKNGSYTNKYQKHIARSYGQKSVSVREKFSKSFKSYLVSLLSVTKSYLLFTILLIVWSKKIKPAVMWWKKKINKERVVTKEDNKDFENPTKCWICDSSYVEDDVKVKDHSHMTGKYRGSAQRDCKISVVFLKLKIMTPILSYKN